ncbi:hypothetical protein TcYC6_0101000 [Trypanosoma cruzi]|nr:hypothetical protein TcYC6_0010740 [Trypanosoma cruzi]KAF8294721.1 hypothetical protein TcYC6_0101000 [Trypanosoma cruzi]
MLNPRRHPTRTAHRHIDHRHRRIGRTYYLCPTAQDSGSPLHRSRRLGTHVHDTTLTRGEEAALARLRSGVSHKCGWLLRPLQTAIQANAVGVRRGCRTGVVMHMVNAHGITCSQALRKFNFPGESERPGISPEPPPTT